MFDNFIVNIRTILPSAKSTAPPNSYRDEKCWRSCANESAIAFLDHSSNRDDSNAAILHETTNPTMLNVIRSYFSQFYHKSPASDVDNAIMLPRVYNQSKSFTDWDPVELKVKEKFLEDIDNVIDKFVRVISVTETNSPQQTQQFYVYITNYINRIVFVLDLIEVLN